MLKLGIGINKTTKKIAAFDADAQAFFNRVTAAGGSLTATEQTAVNTLVLELKGYSIWSSMKAIYPMVGASAAACAQNLKSSSFTGSFTSGWTFASTGATPNGTSAYMNSIFTISGNITLPSISFTYYSRTNNAQAGSPTEVGVGFGSGGLAYYEINARRSNQFSSILNDNYLISAFTTNNNSSGFYIANRTSNINFNIWKNGSKLNTNTTPTTFSNVPTNNILIAASKDGSAAIANFSSRETAFASIGDGLSDTQASDLYTAVQTFNTTLSRQV
jgi:hypothetical protein